MKKITLTELKKQLKEYDQKELIALICELRNNSSEVASYLTLRFSKDNQEAFCEEYIVKIDKCFYSSKLKIKDAYNLVKEFCKLSQNEDQNALVRLEYVECMCEEIVNYGVMDEREITKTSNVFHDLMFKSKPETLECLRKRINSLMDMAGEFDFLYELLVDSYYDFME